MCVLFRLPGNESDGEVRSGNQVQPEKFTEYRSVYWAKLELVCFKIVYISKIKKLVGGESLFSCFLLFPFSQT